MKRIFQNLNAGFSAIFFNIKNRLVHRHNFGLVAVIVHHAKLQKGSYLTNGQVTIVEQCESCDERRQRSTAHKPFRITRDNRRYVVASI